MPVTSVPTASVPITSAPTPTLNVLAHTPNMEEPTTSIHVPANSDSVLTASLWESINVDWREDLIWVDDASNTQHTQMVSMSKLSDNYSDKLKSSGMR